MDGREVRDVLERNPRRKAYKEGWERGRLPSWRAMCAIRLWGNPRRLRRSLNTAARLSEVGARGLRPHFRISREKSQGGKARHYLIREKRISAGREFGSAVLTMTKSRLGHTPPERPPASYRRWEAMVIDRTDVRTSDSPSVCQRVGTLRLMRRTADLSQRMA